ncbi:MAG TPA: response regulator [Pirellulales bacterium]|nr:response regulator [Pirellulales bacterium]
MSERITSPEVTDPAGEQSERRQRVLVVDDFAMDRRLAGKILGARPDLDVVYAEDGKQALAAMTATVPDIVLTDLQMPEMDGLSLVSEIRRRWPLVPTVIMTAHGSEETALAALQNGAASYVPKRFLARDLLETVDSVLAAACFDEQQRRLQEHWLQTELRFRLENDPELISPLVSHVQQYLRQCARCDETEVIRIGIALQEALTNAIFCGNLELDMDARRKSPADFVRQAEVRRTAIPYSHRRVHVTISETPFEGKYVVRDEGRGFDVSAMMPQPEDHSNLDRPRGRGLFLIRNFMDEVQHNQSGSEITMIHRHR